MSDNLYQVKMARSSRKTWTKEEVDRVRQLYSEGYSYREIASVIGRSLESVRALIKRRLRNRRRREREPGKRHRGLIDLSPLEVLAILGVSSKDESREGGDLGVAKRPSLVKVKEREGGNGSVNKSRNSMVMSDQEVSRVIERYLKRTGNLEGARNLWNLHLKYKARERGDRLEHH